MPFGPYQDMGDCISRNQDKDDPGAFCAALHHEITGQYPTQKETSMKPIKDFLKSLVGLMPDEPVPAPAPAADRIAVKKTVTIAKVATEQQLVYGIVYEPNVADAHQDYMTAAEIEKAAHGFMVRYAHGLGDTGTEHARILRRDQLPIVESYLAPVDFQLGDAKVTKGTWIMVAKAQDATLWASIKSGEYSGWSFEGMGRRVPQAA